MSETKLSKSIRGALTAQGVWNIRLNVKGRRGKRSVASGEPGMPDTWTEYGWLEIKLPGESLSEVQEAWHAKAKARGVNVATVSSELEAMTIVSIWKLAARGKPPIAMVRP